MAHPWDRSGLASCSHICLLLLKCHPRFLFLSQLNTGQGQDPDHLMGKGKVQAGFPGRRPFGTGRVFLGSNLDSVELVPDLLLRWAPERKRANEILSIRHKAH